MRTSPSSVCAVVALLGFGAKGEPTDRPTVVPHGHVPVEADEVARPAPVVSVRKQAEACQGVEQVQLAVALPGDDSVDLVQSVLDALLASVPPQPFPEARAKAETRVLTAPPYAPEIVKRSQPRKSYRG